MPHALARLTLMLLPLAALPAHAAGEPEVRTLAKAAAFDDVKFELSNAIIARGLTVDHTGNVGDMLARTGADVGSTRPLYTRAEFLSFCSAKHSRVMMEADPANIAYCPYVIFIYEAAGKPGETVVGYRRPPSSGSAVSQRALAEIDALLDGIIKEAAK